MTDTAKEILEKNIENRPTYEFVNYAVNRALYNMNHLETSEVLRREQEAEANVAAQVQAQLDVPKKRGRPKKSA
jgi:hypothetical protein